MPATTPRPAEWSAQLDVHYYQPIPDDIREKLFGPLHPIAPPTVAFVSKATGVDHDTASCLVYAWDRYRTALADESRHTIQPPDYDLLAAIVNAGIDVRDLVAAGGWGLPDPVETARRASAAYAATRIYPGRR